MPDEHVNDENIGDGEATGPENEIKNMEEPLKKNVEEVSPEANKF